MNHWEKVVVVQDRPISTTTYYDSTITTKFEQKRLYFHTFCKSRNLFNLATDFGFRVPALVASQAFSKKGMNTFVYQFDYRLPLLFDGKNTPKWMGAYHGADLPYTFGTEAPFLKFAAGFGKESEDFGVMFRKYLRNFVATG